MVREYVLPDGRTFLLNDTDADRLGAKLLNRSVKPPKDETPEGPPKEKVKVNGNVGDARKG